MSFPPHPVPGGMLSRSIGMPSRREGPPSIWDTHGISGNVFANPDASSSAPDPQELNPWSSHMSEPTHFSPAGKNGNRAPIQDQRCQSDYHRLKTMVKRSIEQDIRNKNFGARNGNYVRNAVVKNQGTKQRVKRIVGDCWHWESNGQCSRGDNCSFRHDINKRGK